MFDEDLISFQDVQNFLDGFYDLIDPDKLERLESYEKLMNDMNKDPGFLDTEWDCPEFNFPGGTLRENPPLIEDRAERFSKTFEEIKSLPTAIPNRSLK